jgi:hypothetical protein
MFLKHTGSLKVKELETLATIVPIINNSFLWTYIAFGMEKAS